MSGQTIIYAGEGKNIPIVNSEEFTSDSVKRSLDLFRSWFPDEIALFVCAPEIKFQMQEFTFGSDAKLFICRSIGYRQWFIVAESLVKEY